MKVASGSAIVGLLLGAAVPVVYAGPHGGHRPQKKGGYTTTSTLPPNPLD
ncbi:putative transmembrane protein, partial [Toxoplasma gondii CAST]